MTSTPITQPKSNIAKEVMKSPLEKSEEVIERRLTVLETHGYVLGKCIGSGSYATVKVYIIKEAWDPLNLI